MKAISLFIIFSIMTNIFVKSRSLFASDFEYIGPQSNYIYSYNYPDDEHAFDIVGIFLSDSYINKKIVHGNEAVYSLFLNDNSIIIHGDFSEIFISNNKTWTQNIERYSTNGHISIGKYICNKYYKDIKNKYNILIVIKEEDDIVKEEIYIKNIGMVLSGGYSKDFGRDLNEYAFISSIDGKSINKTYINNIKQDIFNALKEYDIDPLLSG